MPSLFDIVAYCRWNWTSSSLCRIEESWIPTLVIKSAMEHLNISNSITWSYSDSWNRRSISTFRRYAASPLPSPKKMDFKIIFRYLSRKFLLDSSKCDATCLLFYVKILRNAIPLEKKWNAEVRSFLRNIGDVFRCSLL